MRFWPASLQSRLMALLFLALLLANTLTLSLLFYERMSSASITLRALLIRS